MQPSHAFHSSVLSHWAQAAPEQQQQPFIWKFNEDNEKFGSHAEFVKESFVEPVNNDHLKNKEENSTKAEVGDLI